MIRYDGTDENYVEKLKYALLSKKERARFPEDIEFAEAFGTKQIYSMNAKNKLYILERFENFGTIEDKDVYRHFDDGDYSIEHIMPQHLTPAWAEALGPDYERIHEIWLHRMANLTLTAYNSKYSNNSFLEKRDMTNGFKDSGIRMNQWIGHQNQWTEVELEQRNDYVQQRALEIWTSPVTIFRPIEKQLDSYTLDDEINLTGRKDQISVRNYAKLLFSTNQLPIVKAEQTNGFYRRLLILTMDRVPEKRETDFFDRLSAEIDDFIRISVKALERLYAIGRITESPGSVEAVKRLRCDSDTVEAFLTERVEKVPDSTENRIKKSDLYRSYEEFCRDMERQSLTKSNFYRSMKTKGVGEIKTNGTEYFRGMKFREKSLNKWTKVPDRQNPFIFRGNGVI